MDDCTVAGRQHRNSTPRYSSGVTSGSSTGLSARPSSGNIRKVAEKIVRCSFQCVRPAMMASPGQPRPMQEEMQQAHPAMLVIHPNTTTPLPVGGHDAGDDDGAAQVESEAVGKKAGKA